ncbi:XRE family transcriptional regulator [Phocaeicola dorei]|nr:XRE family transcriptional regulator [Phocaeicola dorei]TDA89044.1 XRE family transcriptional regulator [Phocaeicola dorei]
MFSKRIKELRIQKQMPQRQLAAALDIDTATYCKIEKGERKVKREQVEIIAQILNADKNELVTLWLADKVYDVVGDEVNARDILNVVNENIIRYGQDI